MSHYDFSHFLDRKYEDLPLLLGNKTFIPSLALFLDQECQRKRENHSQAKRALLESLTMQQLSELGERAPFLKEDHNFVGTTFSKLYADWLAPGAPERFSLFSWRTVLLEMYKTANKFPKFPGLKTSVLVQILGNGIALSIYDFNLFLEYLTI